MGIKHRKKLLTIAFAFALISLLPQAFACYAEFSVTVVFCGDSRYGTKKIFTYAETAPTIVEVAVPRKVYLEILRFWGKDTFTAPMREMKALGHELAIAVKGVSSITVVLKGT